MKKVQETDPFTSVEAEVEVSKATSLILDERLKTANEGRLIPSAAARKRIERWLSNSSTTKTLNSKPSLTGRVRNIPKRPSNSISRQSHKAAKLI